MKIITSGGRHICRLSTSQTARDSLGNNWGGDNTIQKNIIGIC